jgi:hypothetical protein
MQTLPKPKHELGTPHELKRTPQTLSGSRKKTSSETTTTTPTQAKQSGARAALHKDHAGNENDVLRGETSGGLNGGETVRRHEDKPEENPQQKRQVKARARRKDQTQEPGDRMEKQA